MNSTNVPTPVALPVRPTRLGFLPLIAAALAVGCHDEGPGSGAVASVTVAPARDSTVPGGTVQLTATARDSDGVVVRGQTAAWSSSDEQIATVSAEGVATGVAPGTARLTADFGGSTGSADVVVKDGGMVGATAATLVLVGGVVRLDFPEGAISGPQAIAVEPAPTSPPDGRLVGGTAFTLTPEGISFAQPVRLTIAYDPAAVSGEPAALAIHKAVNGRWEPVAGGSTDTEAHTVTAPLTGFSTYAVLAASGPPDDRLVFHAALDTGGEDLFTVLPDGTGRVQVGLPAGIQAGEIDAPAWSPGHTTIAFMAKPPAPNNQDYDIFVVNPDGTGLVNLTDTDPGNEYDPTWSPDRTRLVFSTEHGIEVINADGSDRHVLTAHAGRECDWSPDGARLVCVDGNGLFTVNADGSGLTPLTGLTSGFASAPTWSPDGARILFTHVDDVPTVETVQADGSGRHVLVPGARDAVWSPDGRRIAFYLTGEGDGPDPVYVASADGSGATPIGTLGFEDFAWR